MELTPDLIRICTETAENLRGYARRHFMASVVKALGAGGASKAEAELGWNRGTLRKALAELEGHFCYIDRFHQRGRRPIEAHLPNLLPDLQAILEESSQADPTFQTTQLYTRLTVTEVRHRLIAQKGYTDAALPSDETLRQKINALGYRVKRVQKTQPLKKIPETDAIFEQLQQVNQAADADPTQLRLSLDAKATVLIGRLSRGGLSRLEIKAFDHDFKPDEKVTPFGIFLPQHNELFLYFTSSKVTSDFIVDCLCDFWHTQDHRFPEVRTLVLNLDNGPENHSRRTQFMLRLAQFTDAFDIDLYLAYYPPYHSKYNPIERVWAVLERHWHGALLDCLDTVLHFARSMSYQGRKPTVTFVKRTYSTGKKLTQKAMRLLERRFQRLEGLSKWFVRIPSFAHCLLPVLG